MGHYYHHSAHQAPINTDKRHTQGESPDKHSGASLLDAIVKEAANKHYEKALSISGKQGGQDLAVVNARGVCLMRLGRHEEAVALFRNLVLQPGCTWMRGDRPGYYKCNFATALLLSGRPSGCLAVLHELGSEAPTAALTLRAAIKRWESGLSLWSWLDWKLNGIDPHNVRIPTDFEPGQFVQEPAPIGVASGHDVAAPPRNAA